MAGNSKSHPWNGRARMGAAQAAAKRKRLELIEKRAREAKNVDA